MRHKSSLSAPVGTHVFAFWGGNRPLGDRWFGCPPGGLGVKRAGSTNLREVGGPLMMPPPHVQQHRRLCLPRYPKSTAPAHHVHPLRGHRCVCRPPCMTKRHHRAPCRFRKDPRTAAGPCNPPPPPALPSEGECGCTSVYRRLVVSCGLLPVVFHTPTRHKLQDLSVNIEHSHMSHVPQESNLQPTRIYLLVLGFRSQVMILDPNFNGRVRCVFG